MKKYTVKEVVDCSGVTIKTLYHYQKVGLLEPYQIMKNGYRYYTENELKRLQEIIIYRKLDFSLEQIKDLLDDGTIRIEILKHQKNFYKIKKNNIEKFIKILKN